MNRSHIHQKFDPLCSSKWECRASIKKRDSLKLLVHVAEILTDKLFAADDACHKINFLTMLTQTKMFYFSNYGIQRVGALWCVLRSGVFSSAHIRTGQGEFALFRAFCTRMLFEGKIQPKVHLIVSTDI